MVEFGTPYWWETGSDLPNFKEIPSEECELLVIGGGMTGLSASITAARLNRKVVCVDAGRIGQGASTRNGGMCGAHARVSFNALRNSFGEKVAREIIDESPKAFDYFKTLLIDEQIDCDFQQTGRVQLANTKKQAEKQKKGAEILINKSSVYNPEILEANEIKEHIVTNQYFGGLFYKDHGALNPRKFHDELVRVSLKLGVEIIEGCNVKSYKNIEGKFVVKTNKGIIKSDKIILATNGYTKKPFSWLSKRVFPIPSFMIATEVLDKSLIKRIAPGRRMMVETGSKHCYYRISPDGLRILFGGRAGMIPLGPKLAAKRLKKFMVTIWPELHNVNITHSWQGNTGFSFEQIPHVGKHKGLHFAVGYSGSGVVMAPYLGMKCAYQVYDDPRGETVFSSTGLTTRKYHIFQKPYFLLFAEIWYRQIVDRWQVRQTKKDLK